MKQLGVIILFSIQIMYGQELDSLYDQYVPVTATQLTIREEPTIDSKKLGSAEKGDWVKVIDFRISDSYIDQIDGMYETWSLIEHEGVQGYMYGGYLGRSSILYKPNSNWDEDYILLTEGQLHGVTYSDDLQWYGIYDKEDGEYIEKVNINIEYKPNRELENYNPDVDFQNYMYVNTDKEAKSRILIGTNKPMRIGKVGPVVPSFYQIGMYKGINLPIPYYTDDCNVDNRLFINGGGLGIASDNCFIEDYRITLQQSNNPFKIQVVAEFEGLVEKLRECNIPEFYWFGDINNDSYPDFIFRSPSMYYSIFKVYLSKVQDGKVEYGKPIRHVPNYNPC